ncbi:MAG: beta-1,6-N-acetylglucosaminyltransferase [Mycobacteriales bacterium]
MMEKNSSQVACIVLTHHKPDQLTLLLSALRHPQIRVYLHVDRRASLAPFTEALSEAGVRDVSLLQRHACAWGSAQLVDAELEGLARGVEDGCGYFVLISGQDFPMRPVEEILSFIEKAGSRSYLEHFSLPSPRWRFEGRDRTDFYTYTLLGRRETCVPRGEDTSFLNRKGLILNEMLRLRSTLKPPRRFPSYARPFGGSQWWNLSRAAADHVLGFLDEHPDYRRYHEHTLAPDELFFQSILLGTGFAGHNELVDDSLRFMRWSSDESHPRVLGMEDLPAMRESEKLFGRKLDRAVDDTVLAWLTQRVAGVGS